MAEEYLLRVTAGPSYDPSTHQVVPVNAPTSIHIDGENVAANLSVRIQNYRGQPETLSPRRPAPDVVLGLPRGSPSSSPYFSSEPHKHDQYSIAFSFLPKKAVSGNALVFGNDFDYPIRDRLPPGFNAALKIVKWAIDPGLDGDVYADRPHLYGPALSSLNVLCVGEKVAAEGERDGGWKMPETVHEDVIQEGGEGDGVEVRKAKGMPEEAARRKKYYLDEGKRLDFEFEEGRVYQADFFNPYLDFNGTMPNVMDDGPSYHSK